MSRSRFSLDAQPSARTEPDLAADYLERVEHGDFAAVHAHLTQHAEPDWRGLRWLTQLWLDRPVPHVHTIRAALAHPPHDPNLLQALGLVCHMGVRVLAWPPDLAAHGTTCLTRAAHGLACAGHPDAAARIWLRLASIEHHAQPARTPQAIALCKYAQTLARSTAIRFEASLATRSMRHASGLERVATQASAVVKLIAGRGPLDPRQRCHWLLKLAAPHADTADWALAALEYALETSLAIGLIMPTYQAQLSLAQAYQSRRALDIAYQYAQAASRQAQSMSWKLGYAASEHRGLNILLQQGQRDQTLQQAKTLAHTLNTDSALLVYGSPLALILAQIGDHAGAQTMLARVAHRLHPHTAPLRTAEHLTACASCAWLRHDTPTALREHQQARRLFRRCGAMTQAAQQSLAMAQIMCTQAVTPHSRRRWPRLLSLAHADQRAVPDPAGASLRASLAALTAVRPTDANNASTALPQDPIQAALITAQRGLTLLQQAQQTGHPTQALHQAAAAFESAQTALTRTLPHQAALMNIYRAWVDRALCEAAPTPAERSSHLENACARLLATCHTLRRAAHDNPLTFDLPHPFQDAGGSTWARIHALAPTLQGLADTTAPPSLAPLLAELAAPPAATAVTATRH